MKFFFHILLCLMAIFCIDQKKAAKTENREYEASKDTIVFERSIISELAGSAYRKRAKVYFVVSGRDTQILTFISPNPKKKTL